MLFASLLRLNLRQAWEIYNRVSPSFFHMLKNHPGSLSHSYSRFFFSLFHPLSLLCLSVSAFHIFPSCCSLSCFFFSSLNSCLQSKESLVSLQRLCAVSICVYVYRCALCCLGGRSTHRGPVCLDLYYSLPFAVFLSHRCSM